MALFQRPLCGMIAMNEHRWFSRCVSALVIGACAALSARAADKPINYVEHVKPIFQQHCFACHNADKASGGINTANYTALLGGGSAGEVLAPGDASGSRLYALVTHADEPKMPPNSKLPDNQLALIKQWIDDGLRERADSKAKKAKKLDVDLSLGGVPSGRPEGPSLSPRTACRLRLRSIPASIAVLRTGDRIERSTFPWVTELRISRLRGIPNSKRT